MNNKNQEHAKDNPIRLIDMDPGKWKLEFDRKLEPQIEYDASPQGGVLIDLIPVYSIKYSI